MVLWNIEESLDEWSAERELWAKTEEMGRESERRRPRRGLTENWLRCLESVSEDWLMEKIYDAIAIQWIQNTNTSNELLILNKFCELLFASVSPENAIAGIDRSRRRQTMRSKALENTRDSRIGLKIWLKFYCNPQNKYSEKADSVCLSTVIALTRLDGQNSIHHTKRLLFLKQLPLLWLNLVLYK